MSDELKKWPNDLENLKKVPPRPNKLFLEKVEKKDKPVTFEDLGKLEKRVRMIEKQIATIDTLLNHVGSRSTTLLKKLRNRINQLESDNDGSDSR